MKIDRIDQEASLAKPYPRKFNTLIMPQIDIASQIYLHNSKIRR